MIGAYAIHLLGPLLFVVAFCRGLHLEESVIPRYKLRGDTVELRCDYKAGDSTLYSVKWFKDDDEFFRYIPKEAEPYHFFERKGVRVDRESLQPNRVLLREVDFDTSGQYRCEVSAEGPDFATVTGGGDLLIVEPPKASPVITGGKDKYKVNDTVDLLCTSSPSRPPTYLTWMINGRRASHHLVVEEPPYEGNDGLLTQFSRLMFIAQPYHFVRGILKITCVADINKQPKEYHPTIPETFRAWGRSFQASKGHRTMTPIYSLLVSLVTFYVTR